MTSFLHLHAHGHWLKQLHPLIELVGRNAQLQRHNGTRHRVGDAGLVDKRNAIPVFLTSLINIGDGGCRVFFLHGLDIQGGRFVLKRPVEFLTFVIERGQDLCHQRIVAIVNHLLRIMEEYEFLVAFLLHRTEILLVGRTDIGEHGDRRLHNVA